jgi:hypothetical protein
VVRIYYYQRGWGIKSIENDLFCISMDKPDEIVTNDNPFISGIVRNLLNSEQGGNNSADDEESFDEYTKKYYSNLSRYVYISTYKTNVFITGFEGDTLKQVNYGSFSPMEFYLRLKYSQDLALTYNLGNVMNVKYYIEYSRYEYIFVSKALNMLILGNKQGDIVLYNLEFVYVDDKLVFNSNPVAIIDMDTRLAGMRIYDLIDENDSLKNRCFIYVVTVEGRFECFKFMSIIAPSLINPREDKDILINYESYDINTIRY